MPANRLLQLEDRITRALKGMPSGSSLEPVTPRPPQAVRHVAPRRQETDSSGKNWMLLDPDDFAEHEGSMELRKMLKDSGVLKDEKLSPEAQWYRDFINPDLGTKGIVDAAQERDFQLSLQPQGKDSSTPAEISKTEEDLRNMLQERQAEGLSSFGAGRNNSLSDLFGASSGKNVLEDRKKEDSYVESYRKMMNPAPATDFASTAAGMAATAPLRSSHLGALPGMNAMNQGTLNNNLLGPQFGSINPVLSPKSPLDTTEQVVNQWNKYYTPPLAPEAPKSQAPPRPTFDAPRRKF